MGARFSFEKRHGNPETPLIRANFLLIFVIGNFSREIADTEYSRLVLQRTERKVKWFPRGAGREAEEERFLPVAVSVPLC